MSSHTLTLVIHIRPNGYTWKLRLLYWAARLLGFQVTVGAK